jgi:hypothetical protein
LGDVGLKFKAKGLILFEAVLSLNLSFKRNAEQLVKVYFARYMKASIGDVLFWKMY